MIKLGICNELFEGLDVRSRVPSHQGDRLRRPGDRPFTLAPLITDVSPAAGASSRQSSRTPACETIGLHWLLAKTEGFYLTSPDAKVRRATGDYLIALAEATRDLGGTLMVLGSPKQRNLLPGVTYDQAVGYAVEVFDRVMPAIGAAGCRSLPRAAGTQRDGLPQHVCPGDGGDPQVDHPRFEAAHGRQGTEQRAGRDRPRADQALCGVAGHFHAQDVNLRGPGMGRCRFWSDHASSRGCPLRSVGVGGGFRFSARSGRDRAAEHRMLESVSRAGRASSA